MRKSSLIFILAALLLAPLAYADDMNDNGMGNTVTDTSDQDARPCMMIAKACMAAGYVRQGNMGKRFWMDCMKPILMGKTVAGVSMNAQDVSACRQAKIKKMQTELQMLQQLEGGTANTQ